MARRNEHVSKQLNESTKPSKNQQHLNKNSQKRSKSTDQQHNPIKKPKKTANACLSCRNKHMKCPGGSPCSNCKNKGIPCEYSEQKKKIVTSMKYLMGLQDDILELKRQNIELLRQLDELKSMKKMDDSNVVEKKNALHLNADNDSKLTECGEEIASTFAQRSGRLINSTLDQTYFVGSSSMTLFGLEIESLISKYLTEKIVKPLPTASVTPPPLPSERNLSHSPSEETVRSKSLSLNNSGDNVESNSIVFYPSPSNKLQIIIQQLRSDTLSFLFIIKLPINDTSTVLTLHFPTYAYSLFLMDTFLTYFDGCFYFFNEGMEKLRLKQLYEQIDGYKGIMNGDPILQTIWFVKVFLIFGLGESYLGTKELQDKLMSKHVPNNTQMEDTKLPGMDFFNQASRLFHYIDCNASIECSVKEGSIETLLLYALFLQVADRTIASYFYFGQALRACLLLGMHVDSQSDTLSACQLEHHRRLWWTVYMFERMSSSKAGLPLGLTDNTISTELPQDIRFDEPHYTFYNAEPIRNCINIVRINAKILNQMYQRQPSSNILPIIQNIFKQLVQWRNQLSISSQVDFSKDDDNFQISRVAANLFTEYFQGINLLVRPLLFHFTSIQLKRFKNNNTYLNLESYSNTITTLLNFSLQASVNTIRCLWYMLKLKLLATFGYMDREYLFTSSCTLLLFNTAFGIHEQTYKYLDQALTIFTLMQNAGNQPAELRRAQLLTLMINLDFHDTLHSLILKHSKDDISISNLNSNSGSKSDININVIQHCKDENNETPNKLKDLRKHKKKESIYAILNDDTAEDMNSLSDTNNLISGTQSPDTYHKNSNNTNNGVRNNTGLTSLDSLSDMINMTLQQAYSAPPLTQLGSEIIAKNVDQLDPHNTAPLMSLDEMLNDITHVSSTDNQLWKEISDQAMWLGDTMDPTSAVQTDMFYKDMIYSMK